MLCPARSVPSEDVPHTHAVLPSELVNTRLYRISLIFESVAEQLADVLILASQVRRTKISERIRKLQELVPNMDKVPGIL